MTACSLIKFYSLNIHSRVRYPLRVSLIVVDFRAETVAIQAQESTKKTKRRKLHVEFYKCRYIKPVRRLTVINGQKISCT